MFFFFSSRRRHTRFKCDWSSDVCSSDLLPRVPLPDLADSCARFLDWCAPLLTARQLAATEEAVRDFLAPDGPGHPLHAELVRYDASGAHSWLDEFWPARYLGRR